MICLQAQSERNEFSQRRRQIADDAEAGLGQAAVQIRADDIGQYAFPHCALDKIEIEVTAGMTDVEDHAALLGLAHERQEFSMIVDDRRFLRRIAMRDDVAWPQSVGNLIHADCRAPYVNHNRSPRRLAGIDRQPQCIAAVFADGLFVQPDFDTDADIAIVDHRLRRSIPIGETEIEQLARFVQHTVLRQRDETDHASLRSLMDQFAKPEQVYRPSRAGIHGRGHAGGKTERVEVATVGIDAPVTVDVKVDQTRRHVATARVDDPLRSRARQILLDRRDAIARDTDIESLIGLGRRIENRAASKNQIKSVGHLLALG